MGGTHFESMQYATHLQYITAYPGAYGRCPSRLISLAHLSHEHRDAQPFARGFAREGLLPTLWHMAVLILRAALDPAIASRAKKGEFVTCFDQFDLLQTAIN
jgi:hypothetical protein